MNAVNEKLNDMLMELFEMSALRELTLLMEVREIEEIVIGLPA